MNYLLFCVCEGYSDRALVVFDLNLGPVVDRESTNVGLVGLRHKEGRKQSCEICNYFGLIGYNEGMKDTCTILKLHKGGH